jgi:hypothetical protein
MLKAILGMHTSLHLLDIETCDKILLNFKRN